jgi:hypothetical protein
VHQLLDLKEFFTRYNNIKITESGGWFFKTSKGDTWTMLGDTFFKNGDPIVEKELVASIVPPKKRIHVKR